MLLGIEYDGLVDIVPVGNCAQLLQTEFVLVVRIRHGVGDPLGQFPGVIA
jgi:hypothetical protein